MLIRNKVNGENLEKLKIQDTNYGSQKRKTKEWDKMQSYKKDQLTRVSLYGRVKQKHRWKNNNYERVQEGLDMVLGTNVRNAFKFHYLNDLVIANKRVFHKEPSALNIQSLLNFTQVDFFLLWG